MKKITKLFVGLVLFSSTLLLSGCMFDWTTTYDNWYKYKKAEGLDIPIVDAANAEAEADATGIASGTMKNAEMYVCFNPDKGLTIAIQSTKEQQIDIASGLLTTSVDVVTGGTKTYPKESFGKAKWMALYGTGLFEESKTPKVISNPSECIILASDENGEANKFDFQWKKVLKQILINKLLGED